MTEAPCIICKKALGYYEDSDAVRQCRACAAIIVHNVPGIAPPARAYASLSKADRDAVVGLAGEVVLARYGLRQAWRLALGLGTRLAVVGGLAWWATHPSPRGAAPLLVALALHVGRSLMHLWANRAALNAAAKRDAQQRLDAMPAEGRASFVWLVPVAAALAACGLLWLVAVAFDVAGP